MQECRICLEIGDDDDMLSPCRCKGTSGHVHESCLQKWRLECRNNPEKYNKCELCKEEYVITRTNPHETCLINIGTHPIKRVAGTLFSVWVLSCVVGFIDTCTNRASIRLIGLGTIEPRLIHAIESDPWASFSYYQALAAFLFSFLLLITFKTFSLCCIHQSCRYNKLMCSSDLIYVLCTAPYPLLILATYDLGVIGLLCTLGVFTPIITAPSSVYYLKRHNDVLEKINYRYGEEKNNECNI